MSNLQIFNSDEFGNIRTIIVNGEPMFCLVDVCRALGIGNVNQLKTRLNESWVIANEVGVQTGIKADGMPALQKIKMNFVNESNLYKVIFQSRKESAERFTDWVTGQILPSIRKNGGYIANQENMTPEQIMAAGLQAAQKIIEEKNRQIREQEADIQRMRPKEVFADAVTTSRTSILIGQLAKIISQNGVQIGQNRLFAWMRENGYLIIRRGPDYNMPTQRAMEMRLFEIKERTVNRADGSSKITRTTMVTGRGQQYFINKFLNNKRQ